MELAGGRSGPATPAVQAENRRTNPQGRLEGLRQAVRGNRPAHPALLAGSQQTREVGFRSSRSLRGRVRWVSCPGRGAAFFPLLRRAGTHTFIVKQSRTPDSAARHAASHSASKTRVNAL